MVKLIFICYASFMFIGISSCKENRKSIVVNEEALREQMLDANKNILQAETNLIDSFISKHNFSMQLTGTGLRYEILKQTNKQKAGNADEVMISYKTWLLDGSLCLEKDINSPATLKIGTGMQVKGLEEALELMSEGESARLILPAHLAYGMRGNGKLIPPASILYYELTLLAIRK